jgi:hypothetical protein
LPTYQELRAESISDAELQIGAGYFDDDVASIFLEGHSSVALSVGSTYSLKLNINLKYAQSRLT